jgi:hypothetical protein
MPLLPVNSQPAYTPSADPGTSYLLLVREGRLLAQLFDNRRMEPKGQPSEPFSASANDTLVFGRRARAAR